MTHVRECIAIWARAAIRRARRSSHELRRGHAPGAPDTPAARRAIRCITVCGVHSKSGVPSPPPGQPRRRKTRDRRGRGLRGPLAPAELPLSLTRAEKFDDLVLDAVERLEQRWPQLAAVEFAVEQVPPPGAEYWSADPVPLGRAIRAARGEPDRIVVYRRPTEVRAATQAELVPLVYEVVVEQVAELLGLDPEIIDPETDED